MIDENTKLEHGGSVKISGLWHAVGSSAMPSKLWCKIGDFRYPLRRMLSIIEAYEPPAPPPFNWSTGCATFGDDINAALTAQHGDPTIHTYAGEDAERYGLAAGHRVLAWHSDGKGWVRANLEILTRGTQWRKQPAAPQEATP
jgi:hypothetical protein